VVLGRASGAGATQVPGGDVGLMLASILGEDEASGVGPVPTVVLRVPTRDDASWAAPALSWLSERGRRVLVRTSVRMPKPLVDAAHHWGAAAMLELAHPRPSLQAALLGAAAEPTSALLLHAQHLRSRDIEVIANLGPLFPTLHDRSGAAASLMQHVVAADIRDAHLSLGRLGPGRLEALGQILPWADVLALARAFELPISSERAWPVIGASSIRLAPRAALAFREAMRRAAESCGLRIDHCGCLAHCHLDPERVPECVSLQTSELFAMQTG
jgi:hypothetical protein